MDDVGAVVTGPTQSHLRVQIGTVQVDLPSVLVDDVAHRPDLRLEHAVGRRIRDHDCREPIGVGFGLLLQVGHIDVALVVAAYDDDLHARHDGAGRIGAVGRRGDQADVAGAFTLGLLPGADDEQTGVLTLGTRVGLERHRR